MAKLASHSNQRELVNHFSRKLFHAAAAAAVACTLAAAPLAAQTGKGPSISHFTLPNGLEVVVIPDHRVAVVTHMLWYKVGAADETPGKSGLAHFLEHLMFKGTAKNPAGRFSQVVAAIGGQENAFTSSDYTGYYQRAAREHLKQLMEFEADRMTGLVLTDEVVLPERDVILEEQNQRVANNPGSRLGEQTEAALYLNHPYGKPIIGWRHEIEKLTREDAIDFYKRFYGPNNAILVVAGDVQPDQVRALAEETYGKVARRGDIAPERRRPQEPPPAVPRSLTLSDPRVEQPTVQRKYLAPSFATASRGESEALDVLAHILGSGSNSRLYRALVVDKNIAVNAGAWYSAAGLDSTTFGVYGAPRPGVTLQQVESEIDAAIATLAEGGVTSEELERSKTRLIADSTYARDSQASLARWCGEALTTGSKVDDVATWPERIRAVTAGAVREAAQKWLDKRRSVTGYLIKDMSPAPEKRS